MGALGVGRWSQGVGEKGTSISLCLHAVVAVGGPNVVACGPTWQNLPLPTGILRLIALLRGKDVPLLLPVPKPWAEPLPPSWERLTPASSRLPLFQQVMVLGQGTALFIPCSSASQAQPCCSVQLWPCLSCPCAPRPGGGPELPQALHGITMVLWAVVGDPCCLLPLQAVASFPIAPTSLEALPVPSLTLGLLLWVLCLWPLDVLRCDSHRVTLCGHGTRCGSLAKAMQWGQGSPWNVPTAGKHPSPAKWGSV